MSILKEFLMNLFMGNSVFISLLYLSIISMNIIFNVSFLRLTFLFLIFTTCSKIQGQGSMDLIFFQPSSTSGGCISSSNCSANTLCYLLEYTPGYTGVVTSYTTGFLASCVSGENPYLTANSCTMTNNSGVSNACATINQVLFNLSGNSGGLNVTAGVPVYLHQVCFDLAPGEQTSITKDDITDLTVSIDLSGAGGPQDDVASFVPNVLSHNTDCLVLPVELLSFDAAVEEEKVLLSWVTVSETNNDFFDIQWSQDGISFYTIGQVQGKGNSKDKLLYSFLHATPIQGINYYRLKQVDFDGKYTFSDIKNVTFSKNVLDQTISLYPNPIASGLLNVLLSSHSDQDELSYRIYDMSGRIIQTKKLNNVSDVFQIDVNQIEKGSYILYILTPTMTYQSKWVKI